MKSATGDSNMTANTSACSYVTSDSVMMRNFSSATLLAIALVMLAINITTIVFNIIVGVRIFCKSKHKTFTKFFLISLACADLMVGITIMPFSIYSVYYDSRWLLGDKTCDVANSFDVMASSSSIVHLSVLSFERYIAICRPFQYKRLCNRRTMIVLSTCCWSLAALFSFGLILPGYSIAGVENVYDCFMELEMTCVFVVNVYYATVGSTISFLLPAVFIVCCNVKVMTQVRRYRSINRECSLANGKSGSESRSVRVARTIATLTACFLLCWVPFFFCLVLDVFMDYFIPDYVIIAVTWLGYMNSAVNPILYLLLEGNNCIGRG